MHENLQSTPDTFPNLKLAAAVATKQPRIRESHRILLLCGGPNSRDVSLYNQLVAIGFDCTNFDRLNGQQFDLVDDVVWDEILRDIAAGEYVAAFASLECSTFSKLHNLPGPPPLRAVSGPERYGLKSNSINQASGSGPRAYVNGSASGTGTGFTYSIAHSMVI